jgi:hypothetical protein
MTQINRPAAEAPDKDQQKMLELFLLNLNLFTPEQRERVITLIEYVMLPRYLPIEEEWIKGKGGDTE